jgi:HlyD family secretion protein
MQGWKEAECPGLAARSNSGAHRVRLRVLFLYVATIVGLTLTIVLSGCSSDNTVPPPEPIVSVETVPVKAQSITDMVTAEGVLYPVHQASIAPKITAPVRKFYVQRGDKVHREELLAVLENKDLTAAVVSAQGGYDQAQATYASTTSSSLPEEIQTANLNVVNTKTDLAAQQKLYDSENNLYKQGAIARKQLDATAVALTAAQSAYETAEKHLQNLQAEGVSQQKKAAQGQLESARGQYLGAAAQLGYTEIRSPIDGVVASRAVYPGDIAPAGTPLLVVMDTSKIVVQLHIPQQQAELLQLGQAAMLHIQGLEKEVPAKVTVLSPALDPNSTTEEVWVQADNAKGKLIPGTTAEVSITAKTIANALVIPASAILTGADGKTSVMVVKSDSRAYARDVKTGIQQGALIQILSGLQEGEQVIISGQYGLPDKTKVKAMPVSASPGEKAEA